jgi:predicted GH43/DUF377 family glycosyl hydrolase
MRYILAILLIFLLGCKNSRNKNAPDSEKDWTLVPFVKPDFANPVIIPDTGSSFNCPVRHMAVNWEEKDVFNPAAIVRHDTIFLLYGAEDSIGKYAGTSRIGLAWSTDGLHFTKYFAPVLYPDNDSLKKYEWEGGCEDPRVVEDETGSYILTYTAYDGEKARLMVASSKDLRSWHKHGLAFGDAYKGKYINHWSKSGSIVCHYESGKAIAVRVDNKYWMYWGDTDIFLAWSDDLIHWTPLEDKHGKLVSAFGPRKGKFDSDLVEPGPPAMITRDGIVLIYNSRNAKSNGDASLPEGTYAASQILFDRNDPSKVKDRMHNYIMKPDKPYEISGQVNQVCFVEGLVDFKGKWFLYYGTADSRIAVAIKE